MQRPRVWAWSVAREDSIRVGFGGSREFLPLVTVLARIGLRSLVLQRLIQSLRLFVPLVASALVGTPLRHLVRLDLLGILVDAVSRGPVRTPLIARGGQLPRPHVLERVISSGVVAGSLLVELSLRSSAGNPWLIRHA